MVQPLSGRLPYPVGDEERGSLLETLILNEVRAHLSYTGLRYPLHFWRDHHGAEVDILTETATGYVAIEIKATTRWDRRFNRGLHKVKSHLGTGKTKCDAIYLDEHEALVDDVKILPVQVALDKVWNSKLL
ncbi:MAG: DUF4143 domain-containing protein [Aestuariivita sp.]|nr:DUF4143 domain-containing protein [Aestuariivita sp.]